jgi:hypothetical protein
MIVSRVCGDGGGGLTVCACCFAAALQISRAWYSIANENLLWKHIVTKKWEKYSHKVTTTDHVHSCLHLSVRSLTSRLCVCVCVRA